MYEQSYEQDVAVYDSRRPPEAPDRHARPTSEPPLVRWLLIGVALLFMLVIVVLPLVLVFVQAFAKGVDTYFAALVDRNAVAAIQLTLLVAAIAVPLNLVFGVAAAWAVAKYQFWGKAFLVTLIDLPFSISPVVSLRSDCCTATIRSTIPRPMWICRLRVITASASAEASEATTMLFEVGAMAAARLIAMAPDPVPTSTIAASG